MDRKKSLLIILLVFSLNVANSLECDYFFEIVRENIKTSYESVFYYSSDLSEDACDVITISSTFNRPLVVTTKTSHDHSKLNNRFNKKAIAIVNLFSENDKILEAVSRTLHKRRGLYIVFLINFRPSSLKAYLKNVLFVWCRYENFIRVIAVNLEADEVYSYQPFPEIELQKFNLNKDTREEFFADKLKNIKGYTLNTIVEHNPPRNYRYKSLDGKTIFSGHFYKFFDNYIRKINGTFGKINCKYKSQTKYADGFTSLELVRNRSIDFSLIFAKWILNQHRRFCLLNPSATTSLQILLPYSQQIPMSMYIVYPFKNEIWILAASSFLYIFCIEMLIGYLQGKLDFGVAICQAVARLCYLPVESNIRNGPTVMIRIVRFLTYGLGLILCSVYSKTLSSIFTTRAYYPEITDLSQIRKMGLTIKISKYFYSGFQEKLAILNSSIIVDDIDSYNEDLANLNTNYGYIVPEDIAKFYLYQQRYLTRPLMRLFDPHFPAILVSFPVPDNSPFCDEINEYVEIVRQAGLVGQWFKENYISGINAGLLKFFPAEKENEHVLNFDTFIWIWVFLIFGLILSFVVFLVEIWTMRHRNK